MQLMMPVYIHVADEQGAALHFPFFFLMWGVAERTPQLNPIGLPRRSCEPAVLLSELSLRPSGSLLEPLDLLEPLGSLL